MSEFFTTAQRRMQDEFETTSLANRIEEAVVTEELSDHKPSSLVAGICSSCLLLTS